MHEKLLDGGQAPDDLGGLPGTPVFRDFASAATTACEFLQARLGFELWLATRTDGEESIVLAVVDRARRVRENDTVRWSDSLRSTLTEEPGARVAAQAPEIDAHLTLGDRRIPVAAYLRVPLTKPDGSLYGALCAFDSAPLPEAISAELPLVELLGRLLSTVLAAELRATRHAGRAAQLEVESLIDPLTNLYNRRFWTRLLAIEDDRCRRHGHPASIVVVDLDDFKEVNDTRGHAAGDELLGRAASTLNSASREHDTVARVGGDEFAVIAPSCDEVGAIALARRLREALDAEGVGASLGTATRDPSGDLEQAWKRADEAMYEDKRRRRAS